ncbi:probable sphingolipid transporter spinster homolog 2 [Impatiens glandulifera]|uniref:probable sphingolipid transporter spinster homolog 2 n=1 Tax=Impatiens glandulifera TaxID=253017 RepID=UPI001FB07542|nr:probable sphingolipid transporter spinster homolog 2 [Impatiens glandulifera]
MTCTIPNAFKLLSTATFFGAVFCFSAFCFKNMYVFLVLFSIGEMLVFSIQGPVNYISLHCVKPSMRPIALAMSTVSIHIFGDVPSSPLVGVLQDSINNWRISALILTSGFFVASAVWFTGIFLEATDRFTEDTENPTTTTDNSTTTTPLLGDESAGEA